ncbi:MAG: tetraacyldisaccharide 4'-kinase [Candidatus Omnitrophota bacterium]
MNIIAFIYSLMTETDRGSFWTVPVKWFLYLVSLCYGAGVFVRALLYRSGIFRSHRAPMKVVSVGNLTLGGTGKTPFVIMLSRLIKETLRREGSVLIRGYGWDEQAMLKKALPDVPVIVGEDRVKGAHRSIRLYGSEIAVLDDGFQYWELSRDLEIVLVDARDPFGNGHLFPRGILREPKSALSRADIVVFTKVNKARCDLEKVKSEIRPVKEGILFLEAVHTPKYFYDVKKRDNVPLESVNGKRVMLLSSIGDPGYFEDTVKDLNAGIVEHLRFGDHHNYTDRDMKYIAKRCSERKFDCIVTTEKDFVKLTRLGLYITDCRVMVLAVEMSLVSGKEDLVARLHSVCSHNNP